MSTNVPTIQDVLHARRVIAPYLAPTPLHHYPMLDTLLDAKVYVKHENYQPIGAFKVRGGINFMAHLSPEERARGVVTASTGNHGQSMAYAAQLFGARAVIVVPEGANRVKVEAMRAYGAEVVFHGPDFEASKRHGRTLEQEQGLRFVSSGDEPLLIAGVATHTLEIMEALPEVDVVIVPLGGGSGASGAALVAKTLKPSVQVIAVQASGAPAGFLTWQARERRTAPIQTFAAGLATGEPFMLPQQTPVAVSGRLRVGGRRGDDDRRAPVSGEGQDAGRAGWRCALGSRTQAARATARQACRPHPQRWQHCAGGVDALPGAYGAVSRPWIGSRTIV